jgi:ferric-dicitrate binding protein FerR (iron transport regulator)
MEYIAAYLLEDKGAAIPSELKEWLDESDANRLKFEAYSRIWDETHNIYAMKNYDANAAWVKVNRANRRKAVLKERKTRMLYAVSGIAASLLLFVLFSVSGFFRPASSLVTAVEMETDYGSRSQLVLPDGSRVRLNAGSKISYDFNQKEEIREVTFTGEGFFEVSKSQTPFVITTSGSLQIEVLGTTFNLSAYTDDETIETTLIDGSVEIHSDAKRLLLKPGETGLYNKTTHTLQRTGKTTTHTYGWLNNKIYMNDMTLAALCKRLERMYDVQITLQDGIGETIRYNGVVAEGSITDVLDALRKLSNIKYNVKGKNINITSK